MSKKSSKSKPLPLHYDSIDYLSILAWDKIHKTGDVAYLLVKPAKLSDEQRVELSKVWEKLYNEFVSVFGFSEQLKDEMELQIKITNLRLKKILTGDVSIQNFIRASERQLEGVKNRKVTGGDIYKTKQSIEKHYGIRVPMAECSVREFYSYLKDIK